MNHRHDILLAICEYLFHCYTPYWKTFLQPQSFKYNLFKSINPDAPHDVKLSSITLFSFSYPAASHIHPN